MRRILIAGDRTIDRFHYSQPAEDTGENWQLVPSTREFCLPGGILLLEQLIDAALTMRKLDFKISATPGPKGDLRLVSASEVVQSVARLDAFPAGKKKEVWRVSKPLGFQGPPRNVSVAKSDPPNPKMPNPELMILDDHGNSFRNDQSAWPTALSKWKGNVPIIHKMRHPLNKGRQPDALWSRLQTALESAHKSAKSPQYVLVVSADDLRETEGVRISKSLSWERTAKELLFQLKYAPSLKPLAHCPCIVVLFGWEGAIVYRRANEDGETNEARNKDAKRFVSTLHFDSERIEGGFAAETQGAMFGMTSVFVANLVSRIIEADQEFELLSGAAEQTLFEAVDAAVPECLSRARLWLQTAFGLGDVPSPEYPVSTVFPGPILDPPKSPPEDIFSWTMIPPTSSRTNQDPATWRIVNQELRAISSVIAREYVRTGKAPGLQRSPTGVFGKLRSVDRLEIESYNAIRALVQEFLHAKSRKRPLCLGVFGPPGAGKSFGVEEVIGFIGGDQVAKLTYNVSQFCSEGDLVAACHRIRDKVLEGKTPFVFFDEFDSAGLDGTELGWLRSFLALMQDGKFRDGEEMHPLGKCILVFAGGTSPKFCDFEKSALKLPSVRKGRDFVSRLHGYINIMGPNPQGDNDPGFVLRRALILRSLLQRNKDAAGLFNAKKELQIDPNLLRALLLVSEYKHGTRSMESILDMSQLQGQTRFDQYAIPPREQLMIHVPEDDFITIMQQRTSDSPEIVKFTSWLKMIGLDVRPIPSGRSSEWGGAGDRPQTPLIRDDEILALAQVANQSWGNEQAHKSITCADEEVPGESTPYLCPFVELPAAIQQLIINRVYQIPVILHDAGLEIVHPNEPEDFSDEAMVETLAEIVHGSYQANVSDEIEVRRNAGFLPKFNSNAKPFAELPPAKQESNRDNIRTIPRKLGRIGLRLIKRNDKAVAPSPDSIKLIEAHLGDLAIIEHARWNWQSLLQGYVYKPGKKSDERRTNPCIVPWDKLPENIRAYDRVDPKTFAGLIFEAGFDVVE